MGTDTDSRRLRLTTNADVTRGFSDTGTAIMTSFTRFSSVVLRLCGLVIAVAGVAACTSDDPGAGGDGGAVVGCATVAECPGGVIGLGDGALGSVGIAQIYAPEQALEVTDIAFHPDRTNELWVLRRPYPSSQPCDENNATAAGCNALEGSIAVIVDPGTEQVKATAYKDPNAWHFMRRPPAFAFGDNGTFATVAEARTGNFLDSVIDYEGPTLWSSNLAMFGVEPPGKNGSHLDMLHTSAFGMGIAHEIDNVYWVFNGQKGSIDRYDFHGDHGPGNDDHSDGEVARYIEGQLTRLENVPSHMVFDSSDGSLYIADAGAGRVVRLDTTSGTAGSPMLPNYDQLANARMMTGATLEEVVGAGSITVPSGLALHEGVLYITDNATGIIHAVSLTGEALRTLDTGLAAGELAAFTVGPDGKGYYANKQTGDIFRIDPR